MKKDILRIINSSIAVKSAIINDEELLSRIEATTIACAQCFSNKNKIFFCGNGGSAADAQHLSSEFTGRFYKDREPLFSEALHVNTSYLTAVANDYNFDEVYARLVRGKMTKGDILIGLSTSGNSKNILRAFEDAKKIGALCIAMTGKTGGKLKALADILINVDSEDTPRIQESHIMIGHIICEMVEAHLF